MVLSTAWLTVLLGACALGASGPPAERPNIVLILADQVGRFPERAQTMRRAWLNWTKETNVLPWPQDR